jgi:hypothetical protein
VKLEDLRESRRKAVGNALVRAMHELRDQATPLAKLARDWRRIAKALRRSQERLERVMGDDATDLELDFPLDPGELIGCYSGCRKDQREILVGRLETLALAKTKIAQLGRRSAKQRARRDVRRAKRAAKRGKRA